MARFELARHGGADNLAAMEGMRGLAVFLVFLVHFTDQAEQWMPSESWASTLLHAMAPIFHSGVDLFFVLSGFLIYAALISRPRRFWPYLLRRVQRIYPTFLVVFGIYLILSYAVPSSSKLPEPGVVMATYLVANLLLLPGLFPIEPLITVAWSLSYELFYYIVTPFVIGFARLRSCKPAARVVFFSVVAMGFLAYCGAYSGPVRLIMFVAGILLFEALALARHVRMSTAQVLIVLIAAFFITALRPDGPGGYALRTFALFVGFFILCFGSFTDPTGRLAQVFAWTPLRWLGNMSYSYYLVHGLTLKAFFLAFSWVRSLPVDSALAAALLMASFLFSLVPAVLLFLLVERPFSLAHPNGQIDRSREAVVLS